MGPASCSDPTHAALKAQGAEREAAHAREVAALRAEIAELEAKVGRNSSNSSRPPSQDGLHQKQKRREERKRSRQPSGRKQGAQPGHPGHQRKLVDERDVDHFEFHFPPTCGGRGKALPESLECEPRREQKWEIPSARAATSPRTRSHG